MSAKNSSPLYDETNAFWAIQLGGSLMEMLHHARKRAEQSIQQGSACLSQAVLPEVAAAHLAALIQRAQAELAAGNLHLSQSDDVYTRARALRALTRAQVRAQQVVQVCAEDG